MPSADPQRVIEEIEDVIGIEAHDAPLISAKNGINIEEVLEQIVEKIPAPTGDRKHLLKLLYLTLFMMHIKALSFSAESKKVMLKRAQP